MSGNTCSFYLVFNLLIVAEVSNLEQIFAIKCPSYFVKKMLNGIHGIMGFVKTDLRDAIVHIV